MATSDQEDPNLSRPSPLTHPGPGNLFPEKIDRFLDVISYSPGGEHVFLGASSLNSTLWKGSAWVLKDSYFSSATSFKPVPSNCLVGIVVETGVSSAVFLDNSKLLFGCDSGALRFNDIKDNPIGGDALKVQLQLLGYANEHSSTVSDLDVLEEGNTAVSCSQDSSIKVWDVSSLVSEHTYSPAHVKSVTGVKRQPSSTHTFASTSLDGMALFWDIRKSKPASCLRNTFVGLSSLLWLNQDTVLLGSVSGEISLMDIRKLSEPSKVSKLVSRPVHRLESCPQDPSVIAVCQDSSIFSVIRCGGAGIQTLYQDNRHGDFVRSATWHPTRKHLLTCSWDSTVLSHDLPAVGLNGYEKY